MAKSFSLTLTRTHRSFLLFRPITIPHSPSSPSISLSLFNFYPTSTSTSASIHSLSPSSFPSSSSSQSQPFSTTSTPYPLQYDLIINRPTRSSLATTRPRLTKPGPGDSSPADPDASSSPDKPDVELRFDDWADRKLTPGMDKSKRKYYSKRTKRMYGGSDSEDEERRRRSEEGFVELQPEVVEFHRLHKREEELYFYDAFAYPWDKNKHYKMVYQLEKKYFPEHCLDKAFVQPGDEGAGGSNKRSGGAKGKVKSSVSRVEDEMSKLTFFEEEKKADGDLGRDGMKKDVMERKVEEFFKCLKKVPSEDNVSDGEPYILARSTELPPRWDGPFGTMVLINKPKGGTVS